MIAPLVLALAVAFQEPPVVGPVYRNAALGLALPRPFDDWVFAPATERGTTTVIFHPRSAGLSDHLWGALIFTSWDSAPDLAALADRRVRDTWRRTFGTTFQLRGRDSLLVAGAQALRLRMGGEIEQAVVDVDEYLIASGNDLILLQFRIPRGLPRDSIEQGYQRTLNGLRLGETIPPPEAPAAGGPAPSVDQGHVVFEVPAGMRAVSSGALVAEVVRGSQRVMRYRPLVPELTPLYAVGRFEVEQRRIGRLSLEIWRNTDRSVRVTTARDSTVALLANGWARYWTAFGSIPLAELTVVETDWPFTRGAPGIVFLGADAGDRVVLRELARTWWGGFARSSGPFAALTNEMLPAWAPRIAGMAGTDTDASARAIEATRLIVDGGRFREALRTLAVNAREPEAPNAFFAALGPSGNALRMVLFP